MPRSVAIVLLLAFPTSTQANVGPMPGFHRVPADIILVLDAEYPGYSFELATYDGQDRFESLPLRYGEPLQLSADGRFGTIYRDAILVVTPPGSKTRLWAHHRHVYFFRDLPFYDSRDRAVRTYRVGVNPDGPTLELIEENRGSPRVKGAWAAAGVSLTVGVVWLGLWAVRRVLGYARPSPRAAV